MRYMVVGSRVSFSMPLTTSFRLIALLVGRVMRCFSECVVVLDTDTGRPIAVHGSAPAQMASVRYSAKIDTACRPKARLYLPCAMDSLSPKLSRRIAGTACTYRYSGAISQWR
jgi:hypothetical protein